MPRQETFETKSFATSSQGDSKFDMKPQLNSSMTIKPSEPDEFSKKLQTFGGNN